MKVAFVLIYNHRPCRERRKEHVEHILDADFHDFKSVCIMRISVPFLTVIEHGASQPHRLKNCISDGIKFPVCKGAMASEVMRDDSVFPSKGRKHH